MIAIVDYGVGNLFSIRSACRLYGMETMLVSKPQQLEQAAGLILPGVGAFGVAMDNLRRLDLVGSLQEFARSGRPVLGICLGIQLLMSESCEFGRHRGLDIVKGDVVSLQELGGARKRTPQVGWNRLRLTQNSSNFLEGISEKNYFYFVHSFVARPESPGSISSTTTYVDVEFCSSLQHGSIFACQFHPERSGPAGLRVYENFAKILGVRH